MSTPLSLLNTWGPCPPDGFRYVFPQDGFVCHAWTYQDWVQTARNHLTANQAEVPLSLEEEMQHQLCLTLPPGWCAYDDDNRVRPSTSLEWNDVMEGLKTFARWIAQGCQYVAQSEADRRAEICSRCYLNVNVQGCTGCQKAVQEVVGAKSSKYDDALRTCAVCRCFLRAKVHFPISTLDTESRKMQQMYPGFCWLNKLSENYRGP
jgi:hypothetical protein